MTGVLGLCAVFGAISILIWLGIALHPARPWDYQPVGDDRDAPPAPPEWPRVCILVPARNESEALPHTLPALLQQDYPGSFVVVVIDDRSQDGTAEVAREIAEKTGAKDRLAVISGAELPPGWVGKVWALEQGASLTLSAYMPKYLLLTDADIRHAPGSLRRLVAESEQAHLALNSRMARLRCVSAAERLLIPPFVFFFNLLYPMRRVNDERSVVAAAAGGCVLVSAAALARAGRFSRIKDRIIDDVSLARLIKGKDAPIQLALSRSEVESLRVYDSFAKIWVMVRRTAFTELRYSWVRLVGAIVGKVLMFLLPPAWVLGSIMWSFLSTASSTSPWAYLLTGEGICAWSLMLVVYRPAVCFFQLSRAWLWTLPLAGILYGAMVIDSAIRHTTGMRIGWRDH